LRAGTAVASSGGTCAQIVLLTGASHHAERGDGPLIDLPGSLQPLLLLERDQRLPGTRPHDSVGKADVEAFLFQDHLRLPNLLPAEHCPTSRSDTGLLVLLRLLSLVLLRLVRLRLPSLQSGTVALGRARALNIGPILLGWFGLLDLPLLGLIVLVLRLRASLVPLLLALALRLVLLSLVLLRLVRLRLPSLQSGTVALGRARILNIGPILLGWFGLLGFPLLGLVVLVLRLRASLVPLLLALAAVGLVLLVSSVPILGFLRMLPLFALLLVWHWFGLLGFPLLGLVVLVLRLLLLALAAVGLVLVASSVPILGLLQACNTPHL
jgi:hypothetical protein